MNRLIRIAVLGLAGAALIAGLDYYQYEIVTAWEKKHFPPPADLSVPPAGKVILDERRSARVQQISREYERVRNKLDGARAQGFRVAHLEPKLTTAMNSARAGRHGQALMLLNLIEVQIPRKRESIVPAASDDEAADESPKAIKTRAVGKPSKTQKRPRR